MALQSAGISVRTYGAGIIAILIMTAEGLSVTAKAERNVSRYMDEMNIILYSAA